MLQRDNEEESISIGHCKCCEEPLVEKIKRLRKNNTGKIKCKKCNFYNDIDEKQKIIGSLEESNRKKVEEFLGNFFNRSINS